MLIITFCGKYTFRHQNNVWGEILDYYIAGSLFLTENLNGQIYLGMLDALIYPHINSLMIVSIGIGLNGEELLNGQQGLQILEP